MRRLLGRLALAVFCGAILGCTPTEDGGADLVRSFFRDLEGHRFDAAADLIRDANGAALSDAVRERYLRGWRKAYVGYDITFRAIVVRRYSASPESALYRSRPASYRPAPCAGSCAPRSGASGNGWAWSHPRTAHSVRDRRPLGHRARAGLGGGPRTGRSEHRRRRPRAS